MKRWMTGMILATALIGTGEAFAQSTASSPAPVEVSIIPGGALLFTENTEAGEPSFGNYSLGGAIGVRLNRFVSVEGEVIGAIGVSQSLDFGGVTSDRTTPHMLNYSGSVVVSVPNQSSVVPYVVGGVGGLSLFEEESVGLSDTETFFTGNVGGGVKWYAGRWGLRGDYRFIAVQSKDDAPAFFGQETRYGHRLYGAVIVNVGR